MEQPVNVAMPLLVVAVLLAGQLSVPALGFVPMDRPIVAVIPLVTTLPPASVMPTWIEPGNATRAVADVGGWTTKASLVGGPTLTLNAFVAAAVSAGAEVALSL